MSRIVRVVEYTYDQISRCPHTQSIVGLVSLLQYFIKVANFNQHLILA